jgi:hypothetical protein
MTDYMSEIADALRKQTQLEMRFAERMKNARFLVTGSNESFKAGHIMRFTPHRLLVNAKTDIVTICVPAIEAQALQEILPSNGFEPIAVPHKCISGLDVRVSNDSDMDRLANALQQFNERVAQEYAQRQAAEQAARTLKRETRKAQRLARQDNITQTR